MRYFKELINVKYVDGESLNSHLDKINALYTKIQSNELKLPINILACLIFWSLPESYKTRVEILESRLIENTIEVYEGVKKALLQAEAALLESGNLAPPLLATSANRNNNHDPPTSTKSRGRARGQGRGYYCGKTKPTSQQSRGKEPPFCEYCYQRGHVIKDCHLHKPALVQVAVAPV